MSIDFTNLTTKAALGTFFAILRDVLNEKHFRLLLGVFLVCILGAQRGSIGWLSEVASVSRNTIGKAKREVESGDAHMFSDRIRRKGAGRKPVEAKRPEIADSVASIIERESYGNPQNAKGRVYCAMSLDKIRTELLKLNAAFAVCRTTILRILRQLGYTKQQNKKALQVGAPHPDRNAQMERIITVKGGVETEPENPIISVDAKAKVFLDWLFQKGRQWRRKKDPLQVSDHDFPKKKATPYGIYDLVRNQGFVNLGLSIDTAQFAVESIRRWWNTVGKAAYPCAKYLTILCDGGGSNSSRGRLWKYELAGLAQELGLPIVVHHYPPGCSKFNPVEHRLFNMISMNWAGQPFRTIGTILKYIRSTVSKTGLTVTAKLDRHKYPRGIVVSDKQLAGIRIVREASLSSWNYTIYGFRPDEAQQCAA